MALFSKEYCLKEGKKNKPDFSIVDEFQKLKENHSIDKICNGFRITKIIDNNGECYVEIDGKKISFEKTEFGFRIIKKENYRQLVILFIIITIIWLTSGLYLRYHYRLDLENANRGTFGDMFGAVNALFSGLALGGIIYTIFLQKKELRQSRREFIAQNELQREEIISSREEFTKQHELQREELEATRDEFTIQNETLKLQRFENTFFQMLSLHHEIIDKLKFGKETERRDVFSKAKKNLDSLLSNENTKISIENIYDNINDITILNDIFNSIKTKHQEYYNEEFQNSLNHYYRNLYHIFKFIYTSKVITNKKEYASMVRAQLSPNELFLLFYNCMIPNLGNPKLLFLIQEFDILKNINPNVKIQYLGHEQIFNKLIETVTDPFNGNENYLPIETL